MGTLISLAPVLWSILALDIAAPRFEFYSAAKLKGYATSLKAKEPTHYGDKVAMSATEQLTDRGNFKFMVVRRDEPGEIEVHSQWNDVFIALAGEATIQYGGTLSGGRESSPGERRGGTIVGGSSQKISAGEMAIIPAGMPHQTIPPPNASFTYMVIKVERK